jgi:hypothetical protein
MYISVDNGRWGSYVKNTNEIVTLEEFKQISDLQGSSNDLEYQGYINTAIQKIEEYLGYNILNTEWTYYLHNFHNQKYSDIQFQEESIKSFIIVGKANINSITSIKYLYNNSWTLIDSTEYYLNREERLSLYYQVFAANNPFPEVDYNKLSDSSKEAVEIKCISGFGENASDCPPAIKTAIINLARRLFETKGQCDCTEFSCGDIFSNIKSFLISANTTFQTF